MRQQKETNVAGSVIHLVYEDPMFSERNREQMIEAIKKGTVPRILPPLKEMIKQLMSVKECWETVNCYVSTLDSDESRLLIQLTYLRFVLAKKAFEQ